LNSPEVDFNTEDRDFKITGQSILTHVHTFYGPIIAWLEEYAEHPPKDLTVTFNLNYYNLASAKRFMFMVYLFSEMKRKGCNLKINWNFYHDDEFMREFGQDLSDNFDLPFELVPLDDSSMVRLAG
jgi:pentatricopeptide repeat protein